jgi:hypothetical protein
MIVYKQCSTDESALVHTCDPCLVTELGNVRSFCLIKKGTVIAVPFTLEAWTAAVESGDIIIIPDSRGTFDGGTPKMGAGYGNEKERKLGSDYTLAVKDPAYVENVEFWQTAEKAGPWNIGFRSETQLHYVNSDVTITAKAPIAEDIESEVIWEVEAKWFSKDKPKVSAFAPLVSLFKCFEVTE